MHYKYGLQLASEHQYDLALQEFATVTQQFAETPFAAPAALQIPSAYLALAKQELAHGACAAAVSNYQVLTRTYAQTSEGKEAQAALSAPVKVNGTLDNAPTNVRITLYLSRLVDGNPISYFSRDYATSPDDLGRFTFSNVQPGSYNLGAFMSDGSYIYWTYTSTNNPYIVQAGPICPTYAGVFNFLSS